MVKFFTQIKNLFIGLLIIATSFLPEVNAQISLNPFSSSYSQDFNTLPSSGTGTWASGTSYFPGWYLDRTVTSTTSILTGTGTSNAGGLYSFGPANNSDRALGAISSGTSSVGEFAWGLLIQNNTGLTITALHVSFTGEQWRSSSSSAPQQTTTFWYAVNSDAAAFNISPKSDVNWTSLKELDFSGPIFKTAPGPLDGNLAANRKFLTATIPVTIPTQQYVMLRWKDLNDLFDDHGLAIDDFSMTWTTEAQSGPTVLPVELVNFVAIPNRNTVELNWVSASEKDNDHFVIERSLNGKEFVSIATIKGKGTTAVRSEYSFEDSAPLAGVSYYRLKQVDTNGSFEYSKTIIVKLEARRNASLYPTVTSDKLYLEITGSYQFVSIHDMMGRQVYKKDLILNTLNYSLNVNQLKAGNYNLQIFNSKGEKQILRFIKR